MELRGAFFGHDHDRPVKSNRQRIGFVGLGIMGRPMAENLLRAGFPLTVHSRSSPPVAALAAAGALTVKSPAEVARASDVVITMLPDTPDVELVVLGPNGVLAGMAQGSVLIDMSTVDPRSQSQLECPR